MLIKLALALGLSLGAGVAHAQSRQATLSPTGNGSSLTALATGGTTARTMADRFAERVNVKDYGATGATQGYSGAVISIGSQSLNCAACNFTSANVGNAVNLTGSGTSGATQSGTITAVADSHDVTVSFAAVQATPFVGLINASVATTQSGAGSYAPGDLLTVVGGSPTVAATFQVMTTTVASAAQNSNGSGGTNGACVLTGTTGVIRGATTLRFQINATISGNAISALGSLVAGTGIYTTNPTTLTAEPVTGCGLTGATLAIKMGVSEPDIRNQGNYATAPSGTFATTTNGSGTGAMLTVSSSTVLGGIATYGPDDSAAFAAAINRVNALYVGGTPSVVYVPPGDYLIKGTPLPIFTANGGILGNPGNMSSVIYIDPTYAGDLFSWSNAWLNVQYPFNGPTVVLSPQTAGASVHNITVVGDRTAPSQQNAFMFYDHNDYIDMDDVFGFNINGRGLCLSCATLNSSAAYTRESRFNRLRFQNVGAAGVPTIELAALGAFGSDDDRFVQTDIYAPYGPGLVLRASTGGVVDNDHFTDLRIEGLEWNPTGIVGDLLQIGDAAFGGRVNDIYGDGVVLLSSYAGSASLHTAAADSSHIPFSIFMNNLFIDGGLPWGKGIQIDAGRNMKFNISSITSFDTNVTVGSSALVGGFLEFDSAASQNTWSWNVDTTSASAVITPTVAAGQPLSNTAANGNAFWAGGGAAVNGGIGDTAGGRGALGLNVTGNNSTALGDDACNNSTGSDVTCMGAFAGFHISTGIAEDAFGQGAMQGVSGNPITGNGNGGFGTGAFTLLQGNAAHNLALGFDACDVATNPGSVLCVGPLVGSTTFHNGQHVILIGDDATTDTPASNTSNYMNIASGTIAGSLLSPVVSSCGGTIAANANSSDIFGSVTVGAAATACTVTFGVAKSSAAVCIPTSRSGLPLTYTPGTSTLVVSNAGLGGTTFDYACSGR